MRTAAIPNTELKWSVVGMGCWPLGGEHWGPPGDPSTLRAAVRAALDCGINWFDTAPLYGAGRADTVLAAALGPEGMIATKVGVRQGANGHATSDLSAGHVIADAEASLLRLGRETIDLLQVHWPCEHGTPLESTFEALDQLRAAGKVRYVGVCNYNAVGLRHVRRIAPWVVTLQTPYSLLRRELEGELRDAAQGMGVLAYEVLVRGLLTGKFRHAPTFGEDDLRSRDDRFHGPRFDHARGLVTDLAKVAARLRLPVAAVPLGWALHQPGITHVIAGARHPDQIRQNAAAARLTAKSASVVSRIAQLHGPG